MGAFVKRVYAFIRTHNFIVKNRTNMCKVPRVFGDPKVALFLISAVGIDSIEKPD